MAITERRGAFEVYVYRADLGRKAYVGCGKTRDEAEILQAKKKREFEKFSPRNHTPKQAVGGAAEYLAIAKLLDLGHKVAKPVVDDDGVDLIVDYSIKTQVKSSTHTRGSSYKKVTDRPTRAAHRYLTFHTARKRTGKPNVAYGVDVFVLFDGRPSKRVFYVVPASDVPVCGTLILCPKYEQYREAWHLFGETKGATSCTCEIRG